MGSQRNFAESKNRKECRHQKGAQNSKSSWAAGRVGRSPALSSYHPSPIPLRRVARRAGRGRGGVQVGNARTSPWSGGGASFCVLWCHAAAADSSASTRTKRHASVVGCAISFPSSIWVGRSPALSSYHPSPIPRRGAAAALPSVCCGATLLLLIPAHRLAPSAMPRWSVVRSASLPQFVLVTAVGQREHCFAEAMHSLRHCTKTLSESESPAAKNKTTYPLRNVLHTNSCLCADFS
jgi:hypothetical protein